MIILNRRFTKYLVLLAVVLAVFAVIIFIPIRKEILNPYGYDVRDDYKYAFRENVAKIEIQIDEGSFTLPELKADYDTGFLRMNIKATLRGKILVPYVEVEQGDIKYRQYFERGVRGTRFLNISSPLSNNPKVHGKIIMSGHGVAWGRQEVTMYLFSNQKPETVRMLFIAPHPDDAEIAAFGLYSHRDSHIVTITAGEGGLDAFEPFLEKEGELSRRLIEGKIRVLDSIVIPLIGGIVPTQSVNLGYFDGSLWEMHASPTREVLSRHVRTSEINIFRKYNLAESIKRDPRRSTWNCLVQDLRKVLLTVRPDIIVLPHPMLDSHPDHKYTAIALFEALHSLRLKKGKLYLYVNHLHPDMAWPFGPTQSVVSLPPSFENLYISGLYSYNLTMREQSEKRLALEAMHGLRSPEGWVVDDLRSLIHIWRKSFYSYMLGSLGYGYSYSRRAFKPNELFFVYDFQDAQGLKEEFLKKVGVDEGKASRGE